MAQLVAEAEYRLSPDQQEAWEAVPDREIVGGYRGARTVGSLLRRWNHQRLKGPPRAPGKNSRPRCGMSRSAMAQARGLQTPLAISPWVLRLPGTSQARFESTSPREDPYFSWSKSSLMDHPPGADYHGSGDTGGSGV